MKYVHKVKDFVLEHKVVVFVVVALLFTGAALATISSDRLSGENATRADNPIEIDSEGNSLTATKNVPVFSIGSTIFYHDSERQTVKELAKLENDETPIAAYAKDDGQLVLVIVSDKQSQYSTYQTISTVTGDERATVFESNPPSRGFWINNVAYDEQSNVIYLEEVVDAPSTTSYDTNIISVDLDSGNREVMLTNAAFGRPDGAGPVFPEAVLKGELIIGETSCYECDGPRLTALYTLNDGTLDRIANPTVTFTPEAKPDSDAPPSETINYGSVLSAAGVDYIVALAHNQYFGPGELTADNLASESVGGEVVTSPNSSSDITYSKLEPTDMVVQIAGSDKRTGELLGYVMSIQDSIPSYRTFTSLSQSGSLKPIQVISSSLQSTTNENITIDYLSRDDNGLFYVISSSASYRAFFLPLNDSGENELVEIELDSSAEFGSRVVDFGALEILAP